VEAIQYTVDNNIYDLDMVGIPLIKAEALEAAADTVPFVPTPAAVALSRDLPTKISALTQKVWESGHNYSVISFSFLMPPKN
jgi:hypothetical protein